MIQTKNGDDKMDCILSDEDWLKCREFIDTECASCSHYCISYDEERKYQQEFKRKHMTPDKPARFIELYGKA